MSLEIDFADFFFKILLNFSASFKKMPCVCKLVGAVVSKFRDFAGDITIFIQQKYKSKK